MEIISLRCSGCNRPLSIIYYIDGSNRKTLGCPHCTKNPVITHTNWSKIINHKNLALICDITKDNCEKDLDIQDILKTKLTREELKVLSSAVLDDSISNILNEIFVP